MGLTINEKECPSCGGKMIGINTRMDSGVYTINCANPNCHATVDFKSKNLDETMERWSERKLNTRTDVIKPCPYCGEEARVYSDGQVYAIGCKTEGCHGNVDNVPGGWTQAEKAINLWNR